MRFSSHSSKNEYIVNVRQDDFLKGFDVPDGYELNENLSKNTYENRVYVFTKKRWGK